MDYFSAEEKAKLEADLQKCEKFRPVLSKRIEVARELGDLKENADYHAAKEEQGLNEMKIRELESRIKNGVVTDTESVPDDMVFIGATVRLLDIGSGSDDLYRLVGTLSDAPDDEITEVTPNSPLGEAIMKSKVGETVRVTLRRGPKQFKVVEIVG